MGRGAGWHGETFSATPFAAFSKVRMRSVVLVVVLGLVCFGCSARGDAPSPPPAQAAVDLTSAAQMAQAATDLLEGLSVDEQASALFALDDHEARTNWSNLPSLMYDRGGLRLGDLTDAQRRSVHALLRASTSSQGYHKIAGIIWIDDVLSDEARAQGRGRAALIESWSAENYWVAFFGDPRTDTRWGWLLTGHHLAASFTVVDDQVAFTPLFLGAEPYEIESGPYAGFRALSHEVERGFELLQSLGEAQRQTAVLSDDVPRDILEGPGRKASLEAFEGIPASGLTDGQRQLLDHLVEEYVRNSDHDAAEAHLARIEADGPDALHFAWMGPTDDVDSRYYYRVHGPSILIEYVRERGVGGAGANHIHSIVRDPSNDYGEDWLGTHYEEHHERSGPRR